jgi:hypothetical protein
MELIKTKNQLNKALSNGPVLIKNIDLGKIGLYFDQLIESKQTRIENDFVLLVDKGV